MKLGERSFFIVLLKSNIYTWILERSANNWQKHILCKKKNPWRSEKFESCIQYALLMCLLMQKKIKKNMWDKKICNKVCKIL